MPKTKKSKNIKIRPVLLLIFLIIAVVFTSGCVLQQYWPVFGSDVIKISRKPTTLGTNNVLVVSDKYTLPEKTVLPDTNLQLFISIQNKDNDPNKYAEKVFVDLFDASVFKGVKAGNFELCNKDPSYCQPDVCSEASKCRMSMGSEKPVTFTLRSPSLDEIANIITKAKLHFLTSYDYKGSSSYEVLVVDYNEIMRRQRAGEPLSTMLNEIRGSGPIKIDVEQRIPFITTSTDSIIIFKIRDTGNGELKGSNITKGNLTIEFPKGLVPDLKHLEGDFPKTSTGGTGSGAGTATKKCGTTPGYYCVSGEQMNNCLEGTGLGIGPAYGCAENEKCCVTCESKGNNCLGQKCVCTNNCIVDSREPGGRNCASGLKCCAAASASMTGQVTGTDLVTEINYVGICRFERKGDSSIIFLQCRDVKEQGCDPPKSDFDSNEYQNPKWSTSSGTTNIYPIILDEDIGIAKKECFIYINKRVTLSGYTKIASYPDFSSVKFKKSSTGAQPSGTTPSSTQPSGGGTQPSAETGTTPAPSQPEYTFKCELGTGEKQDKIICTNNKDISLFRDESEPLWFKINKVPEIDVPHRSFYINAYVNYIYELRDSVEIEVRPPAA